MAVAIEGPGEPQEAVCLVASDSKRLGNGCEAARAPVRDLGKPHPPHQLGR
jgi:hypothetical protein